MRCQRCSGTLLNGYDGLECLACSWSPQTEIDRRESEAIAATEVTKNGRKRTEPHHDWELQRQAREERVKEVQQMIRDGVRMAL